MNLLQNCNSQKELDQLLAKCSVDTRTLGFTFWPEYFDSPFSESHLKYLERIDDETPCMKDVICGARGIGKSTLLKMRVCRAIMFRRAHFIVYISKSEDVAMQQTEGIKRMLLNNRAIKDLPAFGNIKTRSAEEVDETFGKKSWVAHWPGDKANDGILVIPRGAKQQVRGLVYDKWRPDLIIVDDLEDKETINNELIRAGNYNYIVSDVSLCTSRTRKNWHIYYADTLKHEDSVMAKLLNSTGWRKTVLPMCNENYETLMDPFIPQEQVDHEVAEARENGTLDEFARECMCTAFPQEGAKFQKSYFKYYKEDEPVQQGVVALKDDRSIESVIICDPIKTTGDKSCKCAMVVWGIDFARKRFYVRDIDKGRYHPDELVRRYFNMAMRYNCVVGGVEVTGIDDWIRYPMENYIVEHPEVALTMMWLKAHGKKEERAGMLEPYYAQGRVWHNKVIANHIEFPLLSYPRPAEWDVLDAAAYLPKILKEGARYFHGALGEARDEDDLAAFRELDHEAPPDYGDNIVEMHDYFHDSGMDDLWMYGHERPQQNRRLPRALGGHR